MNADETTIQSPQRYGMSDQFKGPIVPKMTIALAKQLGTYRLAPSILRALRSRYHPHVGAKQLAKLQRKLS